MKKSVLIALFILCSALALFAQSTDLTYQGQLQSSSAAANGSFDFEFLLFDSGGSQIGPTLARNGVLVANGIFSVNLDFGSSFPGASRFLEIRVRPNGGGVFTTLSPRQPVNSAPYAVKSLTANSADNAINATNATNAVTATNFTGNLGGDVTGTQSSTTVVRLQGRNVAGTAPVNDQVLKFNTAANQWQPGTDNTSAGGGVTSVTASGPLASSGGATPNITLGQVPTANIADSAVTTPKVADAAVTTQKIADASVTAPKIPAGQVVKNLNGLTDNVTLAQGANITITPSGNTLTIASTGGSSNAILNQTTLQPNANFNISGDGSFGGQVAIGTTSGYARLMVGGGANNAVRGDSTTGIGIFGSSGNDIGTYGQSGGNGVGVEGFSSTGTALLGQAGIGQGSIAVRSGGTSWFRGDTTPLSSANTGTGTGVGIGSSGTFGYVFAYDYSANGTRTLALNHPGGNVGIGTAAPLSRLDIAATGDGTELLRLSTERPWLFRQVRAGPSTGLQFYSTSGAKAFEITTVEGNNVATFYADGTASKVGIGTTSPTERLSVNGNMTVFGFIALGGPGFGGDSSPLCRNSTTQQIAYCSSSLRYKKDLTPFVGGLEILNRLHPVSFAWKSSGTRDLGLGAEDVAKVEPLLVTHNDKGEVEGVKYDRVSIVLVNAVKEQQSQIETLKRMNAALSKRLKKVERTLQRRARSSHGR